MASSEAPTQKSAGSLTYRGSSSLPIVPTKKTWEQYLIVNLEVTDKFSKDPPLFEYTEEDENYKQLTLFDDYTEGQGVLISPYLILRMRVEKGELPRAGVRFD